MLAKQDHRIEQVISKPKWGVKITKQSHLLSNQPLAPQSIRLKEKQGIKENKGT